MPEQDAFKEPAKQVQSQPKPSEPVRLNDTQVVQVPIPHGEVHNEAKEDEPKWTDKTVALFTLCLFLVAVIQGIIFYKQWQEMHSGGVDTHALADAAKSQADAAKAQADAAKAQANEAEAQVEKMTEALGKLTP